MTEADLADIDDGPRLFVASHRWALDTAESVTRTEYLVNPVKTASAMSESQGTRISADDVAQTMAGLVEDLEYAAAEGS